MRRDAEETVCYVRDNGIGIAPRYHEKVFGLFERLDGTSDGTGIGQYFIAVTETIIVRIVKRIRCNTLAAMSQPQYGQ